ncbi:MAG: hypothetical protein QOF28_843, partial [Actinomycetota bacterium]|nr:hypothetical protein [Actinomycetota bacterium]
TGDPLTENLATRPDLRVVRNAQSRRLLRRFGIATALLVAAGGYVHFCLYRHGYRTIPKIGVGFLLQAVTSVAVGVALLVGPQRLARVVHVTDRVAGAVAELAAAALAVGTLAAFVLSRTPGGLFNFQERGLEPAPQALIALVAEIGVLLVVGAALVADHSAQRAVHPVPVRQV